VVKRYPDLLEIVRLVNGCMRDRQIAAIRPEVSDFQDKCRSGIILLKQANHEITACLSLGFLETMAEGYPQSYSYT
jgi:hypothetical protein